jgi:hypothetical protein
VDYRLINSNDVSGGRFQAGKQAGEVHVGITRGIGVGKKRVR